ncbi:hypothetical protein C8A03DRAFT_38639 [Achaetomium macrosporum]|uniref:Secreted protein n=1 Tax=Achaetomium macrosporum TaxID=79813 RepID=A0AAN7C237_9PEZI|nr:hypothetical protein C8A03DRAFT_38639 [Achaetomium macrosporum]
MSRRKMRNHQASTLALLIAVLHPDLAAHHAAADLQLLALNGAGVRGISSLMILVRLMAAISPDAHPSPATTYTG